MFREQGTGNREQGIGRWGSRGENYFPVPSPQRCTELVEVSPVPSHLDRTIFLDHFHI
ncbi:hypothetical protein [Sphaerospermopsis sp. FACHB-1094]|uniref:hypothetical protein n=1 Tax=Sphaerospermopsis sp. FACHB-1094 TaxID=2692861 RepID=UPI001A7EA9AD|nr:hypothetical protein [Sphaerospermopsis sp. FACHB-1094]